MTKAERVCRVLAAADAPLTAEELLARDAELGDLQELRVSLWKYVRYEWLIKVTARKPIRYGLHPEWRRRVSFVITETPSATAELRGRPLADGPA